MVSFDDDYFDWVYVDTEQSYQGVSRDSQAVADKIKPGGFLFSTILLISIHIGGDMVSTMRFSTSRWKGPGHCVFYLS